MENVGQSLVERTELTNSLVLILTWIWRLPGGGGVDVASETSLFPAFLPLTFLEREWEREASSAFCTETGARFELFHRPPPPPPPPRSLGWLVGAAPAHVILPVGPKLQFFYLSSCPWWNHMCTRIPLLQGIVKQHWPSRSVAIRALSWVFPKKKIEKLNRTESK